MSTFNRLMLNNPIKICLQKHRLLKTNQVANTLNFIVATQDCKSNSCVLDQYVNICTETTNSSGCKDKKNFRITIIKTRLLSAFIPFLTINGANRAT